MKTLLAIFFLFCLGPAQAQRAVVVPATTASVPIVGNIATTLLVAGRDGMRIYVTSVDLIPAPTATIQFLQGTGPLCAAGTAAVNAAMTFSAGQTYSKGSGYGAVWVLDPGNSLCIIVQTAICPGSLAYAQF